MSSSRIWARWISTFAATFATGALGYALPSFGGRFTLMILPSGIAVAAVYRWGYRMWLPPCSPPVLRSRFPSTSR